MGERGAELRVAGAGDESTNATAKRFASREDAVTPPHLIVEYAVPAPASVGVLIGALGFAGRRRR